jgi:hypothetical protein
MRPIRRPPAKIVAFGFFDFDDVCAKVSEDERAVRSGKEPREIEDLQTV